MFWWTSAIKRKQFAKIVNAIDEDGPSSKRARDYSSEGVLYAETCLHKYKGQCISRALMPLPMNLHTEVVPTPARQERESLTYIYSMKGC